MLSSDALGSRESFSYSENDLERVGKILSIGGLRRVAWYLLDYGAATAWTLQVRLGTSEPTTYRYLKDLRAFNFIVPAIKIRRRAKGGRKGGARTEVWMVPDATIDHIKDAQELHKRLLSPKYIAGESLGQFILEEFLEPRKQGEIKRQEVQTLAREQGIGGGLIDIVEFAMNYLSEQGIKVWR